MNSNGAARITTTHSRSGFSTAWPYRYGLLDGLRGVAALLVVMTHLSIVSVGHFSVMVFFVISGYCITASAESCRERGLPFTAFMARRVRRIYPPYLIALLFFTITRVAKTWTGGHNDLGRTAFEWLQNLTLTQWLTLMAHPQTTAAGNPTLFVAAFWSLDYEEQFYLVMALVLVLALRRRVPMVVPVVGLMVVGLIFNITRPGNWVCGLFIEYWAHFALGSTLFYVLCKYTAPRIRGLYVALLLALGGCCASAVLPWSLERIDNQRAFVELLLLAVLALSLFALRPFSDALTRHALWKPIAALGTISYSLYLIHQFNLHLVETTAHLLLPAAAPPALVATMLVALHVALASMFWYFCERPFIGVRTIVAPVPVPAV